MDAQRGAIGVITASASGQRHERQQRERGEATGAGLLDSDRTVNSAIRQTGPVVLSHL